MPLQPAEQPREDDDRRRGKNDLRHKLRIREAVQREDPVQDEQRRDLQHDLAQNGKDKRFFAEAAGLEHADRQEVHAQERHGKAHAAQERRAVGDDLLVVHKHADEVACKHEIRNHHEEKEGKRDPRGEEKGLFHAPRVAARVVVADQRHDALRNAERHLERHRVDLLGDAHRRHGVRAEGGREVVQHRHARHVEQVLDRRRDADAADAADDAHRRTELARIDADVGAPAPDKEQNEEIQAGHAVRDESRAAGARRAEVQAPRQDENRVEQDVQQAAAHRADARVQRRALRADEVGHDHVEDRRSRAEADGPHKVSAGRLRRLRIGAEHDEQRRAEYGVEHGEQQAAEQRAVKSERRALVHGVHILAAERAAHHARAADAEEVVDRVEGEQHRRRQRDRGILNRVVQHADEVGVREVVNHHDERADHRRDRELHDRLRYRRVFK